MRCVRCYSSLRRGLLLFFFSSRRRHTRYWRDWSSDVCSSDLVFGRVRLKTAPGLGRNINFLASCTQNLRNDTFASPIAVHIGSVEKIDAATDSGFQNTNSVRFGNRSPSLPELPGPETNLRNFKTRFTKSAIFHKSLSLLRRSLGDSL